MKHDTATQEAGMAMETTMQDAKGRAIKVTRYATPTAAKRSVSAAQRKLYNMSVWSLPDGGYDIFPAGHPVPRGAERAERRTETNGRHELRGPWRK